MTLVERSAAEPNPYSFDGVDPDLVRLHDLMARGVSQTAASRQLWSPPPVPSVELPPAITPRRRVLRLTRWERG